MDHLHPEWIKLLRAHAIANYNSDGWDYLVEAWDDADIVEAMDGASNYDKAFEAVADTLKTMSDYRSEIVATGEW